MAGTIERMVRHENKKCERNERGEHADEAAESAAVRGRQTNHLPCDTIIVRAYADMIENYSGAILSAPGIFFFIRGT